MCVVCCQVPRSAQKPPRPATTLNVITMLGRKYAQLLGNSGSSHAKIVRQATEVAANRIILLSQFVDFPLLLRETAVRAKAEAADERAGKGPMPALAAKEYSQKVVSEIGPEIGELSAQLRTAAKSYMNMHMLPQLKDATALHFSMEFIKLHTYWGGEKWQAYKIPLDFGFNTHFEEGLIRAFSGIFRIISNPVIEGDLDSANLKGMADAFLSAPKSKSEMLAYAAADELSINPGPPLPRAWELPRNL
jgi:hypothetical protein